MKKSFLIIISLAMAVALLAGCGAKSTQESLDDSYSGRGEYISEDGDYMGKDTPQNAPVPDVSNEYEEEEGGIYEEGRKTIKTAQAKIEVEDFDSAYESLKAMIGSNGYIEETNMWKTSSYYQGEKIMLTNGTIRIRIKESAFLGFTEGLSTLGTVLSSSTNDDDISDIYYDTEARLRLLEDEKERLERYADEVDDAEVFFKTQERITQVIYEMERLQGTLKKWDSQVEYSTVSITINERHPAEDSELPKPKGFFERIWDNIKDGVDFLGDVIVFFAGILPLLAIIGVIVVVIFIAVRKSNRNKRKE